MTDSKSHQVEGHEEDSNQFLLEGRAAASKRNMTELRETFIFTAKPIVLVVLTLICSTFMFTSRSLVLCTVCFCPRTQLR